MLNQRDWPYIYTRIGREKDFKDFFIDPSQYYHSDDISEDSFNAKEQLFIEEQNEILEDMSMVVNRLTQMGETMSQEIDLHKGMLTDVSSDVDLVSHHILKTTDMIGALINKTGCNYCQIITTLFGIFIILLFLVIVT